MYFFVSVTHSGPAQVPMMSPNGSVPPIYVPPGYAPQVCLLCSVSLYMYPMIMLILFDFDSGENMLLKFWMLSTAVLSINPCKIFYYIWKGEKSTLVVLITQELHLDIT